VEALVYDGELSYTDDYPRPARVSGEAIIRMTLAGICSTDLEITRGYMSFRGVLGHEFVGVVEEADCAALLGKRVVGGINCPCNECDYCKRGISNHCPHRTVLGILGRDGAFAEYLSLPEGNLQIVPESVSDAEAVFTEPLAAALEIMEQVEVHESTSVAVLGDGRLGLLVAQVLALTGASVTCIGNHEEKLSLLEGTSVRTVLARAGCPDRFDMVVDCTGSASGFDDALRLLRPRGTLVLKSTVAAKASLNLAPLVINEITVVGSRCGPVDKALDLLEQHRIDVAKLITDRYPLSGGLAAFNAASTRSALKVLLYPTPET
jgi:threonine dehydrogenase-like Zn-dependent dehydrogenase